jgi:SAM-dependent methyltransferase
VTEPGLDLEQLPRRLNLGCGWDLREGYLNVDFQDFHKPDLVADVRDLEMLPSAWFLEIIAQDILEHLERTEADATLAEWARLLAPGGSLVLRVPDVIGIARLLTERRDIETQLILLQNMFGTQAYQGDYHHNGFTEITLRVALANAGFTVASLEHYHDWLFDVVAVRSATHVEPDLSELTFMDLVLGAPPAAATEEAAAPTDLVHRTVRTLGGLLPGPLKSPARRVYHRVRRAVVR